MYLFNKIQYDTFFFLYLIWQQIISAVTFPVNRTNSFRCQNHPCRRATLTVCVLWTWTRCWKFRRPDFVLRSLQEVRRRDGIRSAGDLVCFPPRSAVLPAGHSQVLASIRPWCSEERREIWGMWGGGRGGGECRAGVCHTQLISSARTRSKATRERETDRERAVDVDVTSL